MYITLKDGISIQDYVNGKVQLHRQQDGKIHQVSAFGSIWECVKPIKLHHRMSTQNMSCRFDPHGLGKQEI